MPDTNVCPECGVPLPIGLPKGLCSRCALKGALELSSEETPSQKCRGCGAGIKPDAPFNYCPNCLIELGFGPLPEVDPAPPAPKPRRFGDYELFEEIGRGGMGVVWRARQMSLNRIVAVKAIVAGECAAEEIVQRFRTEASAAAFLQHPNIVAVHDVGVQDGQHYFSMDYVEGQNLAQLVGPHPLPPAKAARYVKIIAEAIHYAHERGILHRDLKPSNVLIDQQDNPRVTDFGLAKRIPNGSFVTSEGKVLGSPSFMPPEQAGGKGKAGRYSDVYGLGAVLYFLLTARAPFQGESLEATLHQVLNTEPVSPRLLNPAVPRNLETICLKCLAKEPSRRYATAQELVEELSRFLNDEPIAARPVSAAEKLGLWCRRKPLPASLAASTALLLLALLVGLFVAAFRIAEARRAETHERKRAEQGALVARRNLYAADIAVAYQAIQRGDYGLARRILAGHCPDQGQEDFRGFEWRYLWSLSQGEQSHTYRGHTGGVECVTFSPDGSIVASAGHDTTVKLWDTPRRTMIASLAGHSNVVLSVAFSSDGRRLASGGEDEGVRLWSVPSGKVLRVLPGYRARVAFIPLTPLLAVGNGGDPHGRSGHFEGSLVLWNYETGEKIWEVPNVGSHIAVSFDGRRLAAGANTGPLRVWDVPSRTEIGTLASPGHVVSLAFCRDGRNLIVCGRTEALLLWEPTTGQIKRFPEGAKGIAHAAAVSRDGHLLATASTDRSVRLWNLDSLEEKLSLRGHLDELRSVAFSPDGRLLASGGNDGTVRLWRPEAASAGLLIPNVVGTPRFAAKVPLMAYRSKGGVAVWDLVGQQRLAVIPGKVPLALSQDGKTLMVSTPSPLSLAFWDIGAERLLKVVPLAIGAQGYNGIQASPDGSMVYTRGRDGEVSIWLAATGEKLLSIRGPWKTTWAAKFSPDHRTFAISAGDDKVVVWDLKKKKQLATLNGHREYVTRLAFSADGRMLATAGADSIIKLWEATEWRELATLAGHRGAIGDVAFTPDGKTLASTSDGHMQLWHIATHRSLIALEADLVAQFVVFSPDGSALVTEMHDKTARLWAAPSFAECDAEVVRYERGE